MLTWRQVNIVKTPIMAKNKMDYNGIGFSNKSIDKLTKRQKYIAGQAGNPNKIEAADFKALRKKK
jgi:hypothetical protein